VHPDTFFDDMQAIFKDAAPLPGEEAKYAEALSLVAAAQADPKIKAAIIDEAKKTQEDLIEPLLQFRNYGIPAAAQLDDGHQRRKVRHGLLHPNGSGPIEHLREQAQRGEILLPGPRCLGWTPQWRESVSSDLCQG
jgi:hypothetical protein